MPRKIGFNAYTIRAFEPRTEEPLISSTEGSFDLLSILQEYFTNRKGELVKLSDSAQTAAGATRENRCFKVMHSSCDLTDRVLWSSIDAGEFGYAGRIVDTDTDTETHRRKKHESDMVPFFAYCYVPNKQSFGILLLQTYGRLSIRTAFEKDIKRHFRERQDRLVIKIKTLTHKAALKDFLTRGTANAVKIVTHKRGEDSRELLRKSRINHAPIAEGSRVELVVKDNSGLNHLVEKAKRIVFSGESTDALVEVAGLENPDDVQLTLEHGGKTRSFSILHADETAVIYDVTKHVRIDSNGHPERETLEAEARKVAQEIEGYFA